jgi:RNA binding exosome subunit
MGNQILILENYLDRNEEIHQLFMGFFEGFSYEEALSVRYFSSDLSKFLGHLKK